MLLYIAEVAKGIRNSRSHFYIDDADEIRITEIERDKEIKETLDYSGTLLRVISCLSGMNVPAAASKLDRGSLKDVEICPVSPKRQERQVTDGNVKLWRWKELDAAKRKPSKTLRQVN